MMMTTASIIAKRAPPPRSSDDAPRSCKAHWWEKKSLLPLHSPSTVMNSGCSNSGKTYFTKKILENASGMFTVPPGRIVYAYSEHQPLFDVMKATIPNITFYQGVPTRDNIENFSEGQDHVIFTVTSHHRNVSVLFLTQNLYPPGRYARTISLNCAYVILFRNDRNQRQILYFASQILPGQTTFFETVL